MARIAYFQPFSGASGDMLLGSLVDVGLRLPDLEAGLSRLGVDGWKLVETKELRGPFLTTRVRVLLEGGVADTGQEQPSHSHEHASGHEHAHGHGHSHEHAHSRSAPEPPGPLPRAPRRGLREIVAIISAAGLPSPVAELACKVFERLGAAEARVHGVPVSQIHFHEVGAVDAIIDVVGVCLGLHLLAVSEVHCGPITVGTGYVTGAHGRMPLPAPATLELLRGVPIEQRDSRAELTTPTGAALLTTLARGFGVLPPMRVSAVGYGAGDDRPGPVPNAIRVILGEPSTPAVNDRVVVLETNIDDMSPEWLGHLQERLLAGGALDVTVAPLLMKKSRPGHAVQVIVPHALEAEAIRVLFSESTSLGLRRQEVDRIVLEREIHEVETPWGAIRVKVGRERGEVRTAAPEYEDLRAAAQRSGRPLKDIHERAMQIFRSRQTDRPGPGPGPAVG